MKNINFKTTRLVGFALLVFLGFCWGFNWPMMKIALIEIPPWTFRMLCLVFGGLGLLLFGKVIGLPLSIPKNELKSIFVVSLFNVTFWHLFSAYGLSNMHASRATIIAFTMPIWTAVIGRFLLKEKLTPVHFVGLVSGIGGLAALIGTDIETVRSAPAGSTFMLGGSICWAFGTVLIKYYKWSIPITILTGWQLTLGGIPIIIGALILDPILVVWQLSLKGFLATVYVLIVGQLFCQWAWYKVVVLLSANLAAIGTLLIPIVGVFSSGLILGEPIGLLEVVALALVVCSLSLIMLTPAGIKE